LLTPPVSGLKVIVCQYKVRKPVIPAHTVCINTHTHTHTHTHCNSLGRN